MSTVRVSSTRIVVQRQSLATRLRALALATFVVASALAVASVVPGPVSLLGVGAMIALFLAARRLGSAAPARRGALDLSPGRVEIACEDGTRATLSEPCAGWVVPHAEGADVAFVRADDDAVIARVATPEEGHAALAAVGIDPARRVVRLLLGGRWDGVGFGIVTALFVLLQGTPVFILIALALRLSGATTLALGLGLLSLATFLGGRTLGPAEITLGADGIRWRHGFSRGYAAWRDVVGVEAWQDQGILLRRRGGARVIIPHSHRDPQRLAGVVALLRRAWERAGETARPPLEALDRRGRTVDAWRESLRGLVSGVAYRRETLTADDLIATLDDPSAPAERRLAAAMCLHDVAAPDAVTRIRVAADACASDELRVALERAAVGEVDEATAARVRSRQSSQ